MAYLWSLLLMLVVCFFFSSCNTDGALDMTLKKRICNGEVFPRHKGLDHNKPYECAVNNIVEFILHKTNQSPSYDYYSSWHCPGEREVAYGHGSCSKELRPSECSDCIDVAKDRLFEECTHSVGAQVKLEDCQMRYENYPFMD